jgi:hypothetical protein
MIVVGVAGAWYFGTRGRLRPVIEPKPADAKAASAKAAPNKANANKTAAAKTSGRKK